MQPARPDTQADPKLLLGSGEIELIGRLTTASNTTLFGMVGTADHRLPCVYKPVRGERPLHDFPSHTLALRERAAYLVATAIGFPLMPYTALRDGPLGQGMVQQWIGPLPGTDGDADDESDDDAEDVGARKGDLDRASSDPIELFAADAVPRGWLPVLAAEDEAGRPLVLCHQDSSALREIALFDVLVNNADRKGAHLIRHDDQVFAVDHGLTFHPEDKLRTVLWGFAGDELTDVECTAVQRLASTLPALPELAELLGPSELRALATRCRKLLQDNHFPHPPDDRMAIPWPPL